MEIEVILATIHGSIGAWLGLNWMVGKISLITVLLIGAGSLLIIGTINQMIETNKKIKELYK